MQVPEGYMKDMKGHLVPLEQVEELDLMRDDLVKEIVERAKATQKVLADFKVRAMADTAAFVQLSGEKYGVKIGGKKGNVTLHSFDGRYRIERAMADYIVFDERLQVAKELIDECIHEWTDGSRSEVKALVDHAFKTDSEGKVSTSRVLGLRQLKIVHPKWKKAMEAITDSMKVADTKPYLRVYERDEKTDAFKPVALAMAAV
ncbi:Protein of unknown function [Desulfoluna spongiiphila]|uniref:Sulfate transporter n=2 Tax=Desulfoluna spongiiphila TaxID=419481 RepID=A0A1G5I5P4_9BACT|nr:Protein of unknown function [Desulfoluna spongiiphila]VVS92735.1 bacteriophage b3 orf6 [Desulfoluna spongiiphila]